MRKNIFFLCILLFAFTSCHRDLVIVEAEEDQLADPNQSALGEGVYILNEGNMGSNKATLDFFDAGEGVYHRNIYAEANPEVIKEMGDVGNDILIYGDKMYVVINASNKVEVLNANTVKKIKTIDIANGRSLAAHQGNIYVSSYNGPIEIDPAAPKGKVYEIDTLSLEVQREVVVGYQPEEMVVQNNTLFVANSGGYRLPEYDNTISVVDLSSFEEINQFEVAINLNKIKGDQEGNLYVNSQGNNNDIPSNLYKINSQDGTILKEYDIRISNFVIRGDKLYYIANEFNFNTYQYEKSFGSLDLLNEQEEPIDFIEEEYQEQIETPYGITVHPENGDIFITDAGNFVSTGFVYCFSPDGQLKWKTKAGNIPAHFDFLFN